MKDRPVKQVTKPKHVPERTCIACRTTGSKRELIRIVRTENSVEVDVSAKKSGRGAYVCPVFECWELGLKGNRLEHTLHTVISSANRESLKAFGQTLPRRK
jgi:predicted RNA-binding protein YlxR (DUF448 family)